MCPILITALLRVYVRTSYQLKNDFVTLAGVGDKYMGGAFLQNVKKHINQILKFRWILSQLYSQSSKGAITFLRIHKSNFYKTILY